MKIETEKLVFKGQMDKSLPKWEKTGTAIYVNGEKIIHPEVERESGIYVLKTAPFCDLGRRIMRAALGQPIIDGDKTAQIIEWLQRHPEAVESRTKTQSPIGIYFNTRMHDFSETLKCTIMAQSKAKLTGLPVDNRRAAYWKKEIAKYAR